MSAEHVEGGLLPIPWEGLRAAGCAKPERAAGVLRQIAGEGDSRAAFAAVLPRLLEALGSVPDPDMALNNLERYVGASLSRSFLFSLFQGGPKVLQLLLTILGSSQFLADLLIRHPQLLAWLLEPGLLRQPKGRRALEEDLEAMLRPAGSTARRWQALRVFKARETLRIGTQDLLGNLDLAAVTQALSLLAEVVLEAALDLCWNDLVRRHGIPRHPDPREGEAMVPTRFVIIGMGKLGGDELNFSSDIDLLFVYTAEGETAGIPGPDGGMVGRITNAEFFGRLGELLTKGIGEVTPEGHLFRVDMRLRPGGRAGGLVASLRGYEAYYEAYGQTWERQALIKARPVAGDPGLGRSFLQMVAPFVYRQHLDHAAVAEIAAMRDRIALSVAADRRGERNVKLGPGGIREIEFIVQAFQLVYGGRSAWLRETHTLRALHRIAEAGRLPREDYAALVAAYTFLRTLEHRIQILHQVQTHVLPEDPKALRALARRMGYKDSRGPGGGEGDGEAGQLLRDFRRHTDGVRRIGKDVLAAPRGRGGEEGADPLALFFETDLPPEAVGAALASAGLRDPGRASRHLLDLREGPPLQNVAPRSRRALARLAPALVRALRATPDPDLALHNFERFITAAPARDTLLELLAGDPALLTRLLRLFGTSDFLAASFARYPECLEMLADPEALTRARGREELAAALRAALRGPAAGGAAQAVAPSPPAAAAWDVLRRFKRMEEVRAGLRDVWGEADHLQTAQTLTALAEACLAAVVDMAAHDLAPRLGVPDPPGFCVLGLGKLGAAELAYGSDLDLVFVYRGEGHTRGGAATGVTHREYFSRLADRIMKALTTITAEGAAYRVDARLRPGGGKGELAQSLEAVARYFAGPADVWERMAYLRARPVAGDAETGRTVVEALHAALFVPPPPDLASRAHAMRRRIEAERGGRRGLHLKLGAGGTVDVEFLVHFLQLQHGHAHPALRCTDLLAALDAAAAVGLLPGAEAAGVAEGYRFLRRVEGRLRIVLDRAVEMLPEDPADLDRLARRLGYADDAADRLRADLALHMATIHRAYRRVLGVA